LQRPGPPGIVGRCHIVKFACWHAPRCWRWRDQRCAPANLSENAAQQRAALFAELATAKNEADARAIEDRIWTFWRSFADAES